MPKGQADGSAILIALVPILIIPQLAIAIEQGLPEASQADVDAAQLPSGGSTRIGHADTITQPILDIRAPFQSSIDLNVTVVQVCGSHHLTDIEEALGQHDLAILTALLERVEDLWRVILACCQRSHSAG